MNKAEIYWKEFQLNVDNQIKKVKYIISVSYFIDNILVGTIIIPRGGCNIW